MNKYIFITLFFAMTAIQLFAQDGLQINVLFDGRYRNNTHTVEILMKGRKLSGYNLTLFRSITLKEELFDMHSEETIKHIKLMEQLIAKDTEKVISKETALVGGALYYGFFQLPSSSSNLHRYLFYRNNSLSKHGKREVTLIYMEGESTLNQLKEQFK
ncbi:MAG: DUF6108 family protein [Phocaeicola sp.]